MIFVKRNVPDLQDGIAPLIHAYAMGMQLVVISLPRQSVRKVEVCR